MSMKFEVKNRWTGAVQFTADIDCDVDASISLKLGLAVKWAINAGAYLANANLADANLACANLARAYLAGANLVGANLAHANLADAYLADANLAGANLAGAYLAGANLACANLADACLAGAYLAGANLARANLVDANLVGAYLAGAYLAGANLVGANLAGAYLAGALKLDSSEIPVVANIDAAILAAIEAGGSLDMSSWHGQRDAWCGTTHCRAGWAIHLAGKQGKALQDRFGPQIAGTLIYEASRPGKPAPFFFATNEDALADIRACAAESQS